MVSIIIPIYNVEQYVAVCLESVASQTYTDYEVILVDDCGMDGSMRIVNDYVNLNLNTSPNHNLKRNRWRIIRYEKNRGLSAARNTGTAVAKGKYIYYLDSDDTITPDCLEKLVAEAECTDAEMVVGNINVIGDDKWIPRLKQKELLSGDDCFHCFLRGGYYMMAWNKLVRRDFLEQNNISFVEGMIHEDCAWSLSIACVSKKIAFVYDETYNYLVRSNSIQTGKDFTKHFNAYCTLLKYYADETTKYGKATDPEFRWWYERQKALHFGQTKNGGTKEQLRKIYSIIRQNLPQKGLNKMQIHYYLPSFLGVLAYKKWYGMYMI